MRRDINETKCPCDEMSGDEVSDNGSPKLLSSNELLVYSSMNLSNIDLMNGNLKEDPKL